jgi:glycosyltransferase involved in cell wall biosynthesis
MVAAIRGWKEWFRLKGKDRLRYAYALYFMSNIFQRLQGRVLHMHHISNLMTLAARTCGYEGAIVAHIHSHSHILDIADTDRRRYAVRTAERLLTDVNAVIHVSEAAQRQGRRLGIEHERPELVIYNGAATGEFRPKIALPDYSVCFVGAFLPIKGVEKLLDAMEEGAPFEKPWCWVGAGPLQERIRDRSAAAGVACHMTGWLPKSEVRSFMRKSAVLCVPSKSESFGQVYTEALGEGTPIVGYGEVIREFRGLFGESVRPNWLVPFDHDRQSASELATAIEAALDFGSDRSEHRLIWEGIRREFDWAGRAAGFDALYQGFLNRGNESGETENNSRSDLSPGRTAPPFT